MTRTQAMDVHTWRFLMAPTIVCAALTGGNLSAAEPVSGSDGLPGSTIAGVTADAAKVQVPGTLPAASPPPGYVWFYQPYQTQTKQQDQVEARRKLFELQQSMRRYQMSQEHERRERLRARLATRLEHYRLAQQNIRRRREMLQVQYAHNVDPLSGRLRLPELMQEQYPDHSARLSRLMSARSGQGGPGSRIDRELNECCDALTLRLKSDLRRGALPAEEYRHYRKLVEVIELNTRTPPLQWTLSEN